MHDIYGYKKEYVIYVHFNKQGSSAGMPWTLHTSRTCIPAKSISIEVPSETVFKPTKRSNPKAFIKVKGYIHDNVDGSFAIRDYP